MQPKNLRNGFTTGTCSAAAAKAAALWLLGQPTTHVHIFTPKGIPAVFLAEKRLEPDQVSHQSSPYPWFAVQKDAGDDPDVTNGTWILASIRPCKREELLHVPDIWYRSDDYPNLFLTGGPGIGIVTKPGLACPVGKHAINPVPRSMIFQAVGEVFETAGKQTPCLITIKIPEGAELAARTFNPKLGIEGGISVLGTSGIVEPMSEQALLDTIRLEIHMRAESGAQSLILTPGNYGERFIKEELGLAIDQAVTCSNFVADAIEAAAGEGISNILFVGHIGKMIKVAGGVRNTHSKYGDRRMEILAECIEHCPDLKQEMLMLNQKTLKQEAPNQGSLNQEAPNQESLNQEMPESEWAARLEKIKSSNTTEEALDHLSAWGWKDAVMNQAAGQIWQQMNRWGNGKVQVEVVTFSTVYGILGKSKNSMKMIEEWRTNTL